ncbi:MAG TPA: hypothetical protein VK327_14985, partial [Candidatus Paceibacterota bacterium]|nr:hypothetical protein [Candidatus Paceibacterota bacterium]
MKKVAIVFVLAVLLPSLVLAWLAVRSLRDQQFVLERQQSLICQGVTDSVAKSIQDLMAQRQHEFGLQTEALLARNSAREIAVSFDEQLRTNWPIAKVGFVVTTGGEVLSPQVNSRTEAAVFRKDNEPFLSNRKSEEVYFNNQNALNAPVAEAQTPTDSSLGSWSLNRSRAQPQTKAVYESAPAANTLQMKAPAARNIYPQQKVESFKKQK